MNKICTDVEQSKKLIELGIDLKTADMWYQHIGDSFKDGITKPIYFPMVMRDEPTEKDIPAWSLSALLALMPVLDIDGEPVFFWLTTGLETWYAEYVNEAIFDASNPIDAVYEMVCWLLEHNKI